MRNLEIKARYINHAILKRLLRKIGAQFVKSMRQTDTYFSIPVGRLKLREIDGKSAELIYYQRDEKATKLWSDYYTYTVKNPKELKEFLDRIFSIKVVVDKVRVLYRYKNAKIHIDRVRKLGNFIEIEVEVKKGENQAKKLMGELLNYLKIPKRYFIKKSYSDLLIAKLFKK